jgi:DNA-binding transcriptional LysR family regulator
MNTLHFKYAVEVEKTGSISQAAENLFMAQPNLSKAIKELEDTLGIVIFERTSKGVRPTAQGKEFLDYAKRILIQLDKMESIYIPQSEREKRQMLKVSIPRGSYISVGFANFVSGLDMEKGIDITIQETNSMQTIANVADNGYNLGIIRYQTLYENYFIDYLKEKSLESEPIWEFSCLALMSEEHPLAQCDELEINELNKASIEIVHGDSVVPYLPAAEVKQTVTDRDYLSKKIYVYERGSEFELLTRVTNTFMWVSPLPQDLLDRYHLVQRRCNVSNNTFKDVFIYPHDYKLSNIDKLFLNKLYEMKNEVAFLKYR